MKRYTIIHDETVVRSFMCDVMPELGGRTQAYFLSLAARKKYFTAEQRKEYALAHSEMFGRKLVTSKAGMLKALREFELPEGSYTVRKDSDQALPVDPHVLTAYVNLHPVDTVTAWTKANQRVAEGLLRAAQGSGIDEHFVPPMSTFMTECQKSRAFKHFVDVDFDVPFLTTDGNISPSPLRTDERARFIEDVLDALGEFPKSFPDLVVTVVYTSSGFHLLFKTSTLSFNFMDPIHEVVNKWRLDDLAVERDYDNWEVDVNKSAMIPMPGTYQPVKGGGRHPVTYQTVTYNSQTREVWWAEAGENTLRRGHR